MKSLNMKNQRGVSAWTWAFALALALPFAACSDDPENIDTPDTDIPDEGDTDVDEPDLPIINPGGEPYAESCESDDDCQSDYCVQLASTEAGSESFCTYACTNNNECPTDPESTCLFVTDEFNELVQICLPTELCLDEDNDGYGVGPGCTARDCDDTNGDIYPGAPEVCDGVDNDCDGVIDDTPIDTGIACDTPLPGVCGEGTYECVLGVRECVPNLLPDERNEVCDGLDNDCDGNVDEGPGGGDLNFVRGVGVACASPGSFCADGVTVCDSEAGTIFCETEGTTPDVLDLCDFIDNDCDGQFDEDVVATNLGDPCTDGEGVCQAGGIITCVPEDPEAAPACNAAVQSDNASPETCNYIDDDCDGDVDEDFVDGGGLYADVENCGGCGVTCLARWEPQGPAAFGVAALCTTGGPQPTCDFECLPGRIDLNNTAEDGCEFQADPDAIYVATATRGGIDGPACGTYNAPCATLNQGITRAEQEGASKLMVGEGNYAEGVELSNGISLLGGYRTATWERDTDIFVSTISGNIASGNDAYAVFANNISEPTELSGFAIEGPNAGPGGNSIGIYIRNSGDALTIRDNSVIAGRGGAGSAGAAGSNGMGGMDGANGNDRSNDNTSCNETNGIVLAGGGGGTTVCPAPDANGVTNVSGGDGGAATCPNANGGDSQGQVPGEDGNGTGGGDGGVSANHTTPGNFANGIYGCRSQNEPRSPEPGEDGNAGSDGNGGSGAGNNAGSIDGGAAMWRGATGAAGQNGTHGAGGGGGGAGEGIEDDEVNPDRFHYGATGGGGGAGGCAANAGQGGSAGGASFAVFVYFSSSASSVPTIEDNLLSRGQGGRGGAGGLGGVGGEAGEGGEGGQHTVTDRYTRCGENASRGGNGGRGGHGGGGGGGAGGVSFDIAVAGASAAQVGSYDDDNTFAFDGSTNTAGAGGIGGGAIANPGQPGTAGAFGNLRVY